MDTRIHSQTGILVYRISIATLGLVFLLAGTLLDFPRQESWGMGLLILFLTGFLTNFPFSLNRRQVTLSQLIVLGGVLLYDPIIVAWGAVLGICAGTALRVPREKRDHPGRVSRQTRWANAGFQAGSAIVASAATFLIVGWGAGPAFPAEIAPAVFSSRPLPTALIFAAIHGGLLLGGFDFRSRTARQHLLRDLSWLILMEFLPIPLLVLTVETAPAIGIQAMLALGGVTMIVAVLVHAADTARLAQERRVQELSILDRVSQTLRSTLDLKELLPVIQEQVTQIFGIDNFYVALYDQDTDEIWYPLAVKHGQRRSWERRPMENRLTDRVIRERRPVMLTPQTQAGPNPVGLPPSEETPASWLGIPLIVSDRSIGCLAVSELTTGVEFSSNDVDLLTILSGQVSVAIDNALLYERAQKKAAQLETLNQLTATLTASLNLDEVLAQVCSSVSLVGGGGQSAVFLLIPGEDQVRLAHAHGLPDSFARRSSRFSLARSRRTRCLRTGRPIVIPDVQASSLSMDLIQLFRADGVRAFADFPLVAPDGQIGFLSVFFKQPHDFRREEIDLLKTFAAQAALAVSNARLHAVTDAQLSRRAHQLAILEAVGRELSAAIHSDELFQLILDYALEFTHSTCGAVVVYSPQDHKVEMKASRGYDSARKIFSADRGVTGRAIRTRQTINIGDVTSDPDYIDLRNGNSRSQLSVPIIHEDRILGVITLENAEINAYEESERSLAMQLANQAAIALVNADLYGETQRRLLEQSTLYQVSTCLVGVMDVGEVVGILERALNAVFVSEALGIYLLREEGDHFVLQNPPREPGGELPSEIAVQEAQSLGIGQARLKHISLAETRVPGAQFRNPGQVFVFPLIGANRLLGFVLIQVAGDRSIPPDQLELMEAITAQGAIIIQSARLFSDVTHGRDRLSAIINSVGEGIIMADTEGKIMLLNDPIRIFTGVPLDQLIHTSLAGLPAPVLNVIRYTREELEQLQAGLRRGQIPAAQKIEYQVPDSAPRRVLERETSPVFGQDGRIIGWMIVLRDETEEFEINQARELITETLIHDLRSPMSAVVGAMEMMESVLTGDERDALLRQSLRVAQSGARRVLGLVETLLEIARLQSGQVDIILNPVNLSSVVSGLIADFTLLANEYGLIIRNEVPPDLPVILADEGKISRVIMNILDNAIKFTPEGGQVRVDAALTPDGLVAVRIADSGPGIPGEYREKVFERFSQIPGRRSRRRGSGLGLAFCKLIVEAHGGEIWVESAPGGGSMFVFTLPNRGVEGKTDQPGG